MGKGGKSVRSPLPHRPLALLRHSWVPHRHPGLLFPAPGRGRSDVSTATAPMPKSRRQEAFREALQQRGLHKQASGHTLRHSWATHRLEAGVPLRLLQEYLGHNSPTTTSIYPHLTARAEQLGAPVSNRLMAALCWANSLTSAAAMAPSTGPNLATGCRPLLCGLCTTSRTAARRVLVASSSTVRHANRPTPAITPASIDTAPRVKMTQPSQG